MKYGIFSHGELRAFGRLPQRMTIGKDNKGIDESVFTVGSRIAITCRHLISSSSLLTKTPGFPLEFIVSIIDSETKRFPFCVHSMLFPSFGNIVFDSILKLENTFLSFFFGLLPQAQQVCVKQKHNKLLLYYSYYTVL